MSVAVERPTTTALVLGTDASPESIAHGLRGPGAITPNAVLIAHTDGDTIRVRLLDPGQASGQTDSQTDSSQAGGSQTDGSQAGEEKVRLIGIDTPETKRPGSPIQCFGPEASHFIELLLPVGTPLALELDVEERDRYGRLLAYVRRAEDGLFINEQMALNGYAMLLTYPPNVAYTETFREAVMTARDAELGLWRTCGEQAGR